ncbi:nucleotide exchange factor GrpE [Candidatus Pelagisphaera phototrophica]|uniref:nucleotide exchange factor GrpE n=1 Tax=Candidatus Pelagisphaera phototrophica TaxID=2684113 RepID=UPI001A0F2434|nr:nucleotide exchange factor GrpE [Candidatus Pelagisphaera phototrophica]QXD32138.1 nucleotide exchange factor GrpE [Candidatus Pelagisphaera phototrophica]
MNKAEEKENTEDPIEGVAEESVDSIEASGEGEAVEEQPVEKELSLEEQLAEAKALADENYKNYLRAVADLDTYRRRVIREKDDLRQYAVSGLLESILPIYDNMGLGLMSAEQAVDPNVVAEGIRMVITQFQTVLGENGIEEISPVKGDAYDHNLHEAVQTQPSDEVEAGAVLQLVRRGFSLNGRLIRPATVIVSGEASE